MGTAEAPLPPGPGHLRVRVTGRARARSSVQPADDVVVLDAVDLAGLARGVHPDSSPRCSPVFPSWRGGDAYRGVSVRGHVQLIVPVDRSRRAPPLTRGTRSRRRGSLPPLDGPPGRASGGHPLRWRRPHRPRGRSSMVEPQSSKLATRVRFPSPAPRRSRRSVRYRPRRRTAGP
jgi:hypothetical protein